MKVFLFWRALLIPLLIAVPAVSWALDLPATGVWNGYNGHLNVLECINGSGSEGYRLAVDVKSNDGSVLTTVPLNLPPRGTKHLVLNDFGLTDAYGTIVIRNTEAVQWNYTPLLCHTAFYRLTQPGAPKAVEYAFSIPVGIQLYGWTSGVFNSMNPAGGSAPVQNWLTVYNTSDTPLSAEVRVYDQAGVYSEERSFRVSALPPGQRHDFALGHEEGQVVGMYQIAPETWTSYGAFVTRYSPSVGSSFNFAFPLIAGWGRSDSGAVPASTMDPADNWAEIANPNWNGVSVNIEVRNNSGALVHEEERHIPSRSQSHLYLNQYLGSRAVGAFRVRAVDGSSSIIVESLFYGRPSEVSQAIEWAYASQSQGETILETYHRLIAPLNTYLGASNWTKYLSSDAQNSPLEMTFHDAFGSTMNRERRILPASGSADIDAHRFVGYDRVGASASAISSTTRLSAEHIRVFPSQSGGIGYIMNIAPVAVYDWSGQPNWEAPLGVPEPPFGIEQVVPATPTPWTSDRARYYYVDNTHPQCSDEGYGYPAAPRCRIPNDLLAGSIVEIHGLYNVSHSSPNTITAHGTVTAPVYIRGKSEDEKPLITASLDIIGSSYLILENLEFADADGDLNTGSTGKFVIADRDGIVADSDHIVLRNSDVHGNLEGGGVALGGYAGSTVTNVLIWNNRIHDNGNWQATFDQDVHGIAVGKLVQNVWILDNFIYRNSGDGVQINGGEDYRRDTFNFFIGRNTVYQNKQTAFWSKQATDVIVTQNTVFDHSQSDSSPGAGMGFQYGPDRVWFLFNHIYNTNYGIIGASDAGTSDDGYYAFVIGNLIHDVRSASTFDPNNPYSDGQAIHSRALQSMYFVNNTIYNCDAGIACLTGTRCYFSNNSISQLSSGARHIFVLDADVAAISTMQNNLLYQPGTDARITWGATFDGVAAFVSGTGKGAGSIEADPDFESPETLDFIPRDSSPLIDSGIQDVIYDTYYERYQVWVRRDRRGAYRAQGVAFDIGAYEAYP